MSGPETTTTTQMNGSAVPAAKAAPPPLTPEQMAIVKSTAPVLKEHGVTITTLFYKEMIAAHPELRDVFSSTSQATGAQPRALAASLTHAVSRIAHKHVSLGIRPEQYDIVGHHLIQAIGAVLGDAATPAIVGAWTAAYAVLADIFIGLEGSMYAEHSDWIGFRKFKVLRKQKESDVITSFYLAPSDGKKLPPFKPGQYISLQLFVPKMGHLQSRQYSMSEAPRREGDYYRISVKRDDGTGLGGLPDAPGIVSVKLHDEIQEGDEVEVSHPQGEFFVDPAEAEAKRGAPLVLLSAGVGATPLMSILESVTVDPAASEAARTRPVSWVHVSRSSRLRPFEKRVAEIEKASEGGRVRARHFLSTVDPAVDVEGVHYHFGGARMDLARLDKEADLHVSDPRAEYYICGPEPWMLDTRERLEAMGVSHDRIHLELFATGDVQ
ncbi:flavohemoglobin [Magnaporthiopsis poae ATCC 64411]|uniref:nitric oxide dioxygenase n=1 Tax=Magnaporthiopsis poae (strain ATCC 64411 / 73-15) TaxID=644358 RepID=A0A0C4E1F1_MAGP6|nr:flavohemoglobin [Magnaporthiopsis poae ATCC 64411]